MKNFFNVQSKNAEMIQNSEDMRLYLERIFDETEDQYSLRINEEEKKAWYEKCLNDVDAAWQKAESWQDNKDSEKLEKLYHLVKGNLLLRKGQNQDELFTNSKESYHDALKLLRKHVKQEEDGEWDIIDLLIQLSIGKYFRNLGHRERRSNFYIAISELEKVEQRIKAGMGENRREAACIWLDVRVNIGRAYKNLYNLTQAKKYFSEIIVGIGAKAGDEAQKALQKVEQLGVMKDKPVDGMEFYEQIEGDQALYRSYLIQGLVQLAIVYRKERKYDIARGLCDAVVMMNHDNVDAVNNLGVCYRKEGDYEKAKEKFEPLMKNKNRFAEINYWKCVLKEIEKTNDREMRDKDKADLNEFMKRGAEDREIRLLKGRFLQQQGKLKKAFKVFYKLYGEYPYIKPGTIGLKAYYSMAKCLIMLEKYQQAERILREIIKLCEDDRLAGIDLGWCMMQMNQYKAAKEQYKTIMKISKTETEEELEGWCAPANWPQFERMKVQNNLGECYLRTKNIKYAKIMFEKVYREEKENVAAIGFMAQCHMLDGERARKKKDYNTAKSEYEEAIQKLEKVQRLELVQSQKKIRKDAEKDIQVISRLIVAKGAYIQIVAEETGTETEEYKEKALEYKKYIEGRLLYYPNFCYMQKACYEIARFLKALGNDEQYEILYRAFSDIHLWKEEEGWRTFSHYMKSQAFLCLKANERGKILMYLFLIYGDVIRIKEECRYSPDASNKNVIVPRHYTTINVLKILLADQNKKEKQGEKSTAKLRLWNSVYMNDPYEGVCFLDLMGHRAGNKGKKILSEYFPHLNNNETDLSPVSGNVYITSLTKQQDNLLMWMTYADKAEGCSIAFADDFFDIRSRIDGSMGFPVYADHDYPLYEVQYIDEKEAKNGNIRIINAEVLSGNQQVRKYADKAERIRQSMEDILENIQALEKYMRPLFKADDPRADAIRGFIADALNEVRYLFKYAEYAQEQEMRVVSYSYNPQFDEKFDVPRMYAEVEREIQIKEVMLGAKISPEKTEEIVSWLYATGKVERVTKSGKHFK